MHHNAQLLQARLDIERRPNKMESNEPLCFLNASGRTIASVFCTRPDESGLLRALVTLWGEGTFTVSFCWQTKFTSESFSTISLNQTLHQTTKIQR